MSRNPDKESGYLQDVVVPKGEAREPRGFDIDREFGKGTRQRLEQELRKQGGIGLDRDGWYRVLFDTDLHESKDTTRRTKDLIDEFNVSFKKKGLALGAARVAALSRILEGVGLASEKERGTLKKWLQNDISVNLRDGDFWGLWGAARSAANYRVLFDEIPLGPQDVQHIENTLRQYVKAKLAIHETIVDLEAAASAALLRILKAHEIKFVPGKGIEIIDSPQQFEKKPIPPMPEERKF